MTALHGVAGGLLVLTVAIIWLAWEVRRVYAVVAPIASSDLVQGLAAIRV